MAFDWAKKDLLDRDLYQTCPDKSTQWLGVFLGV